LVWPEYKFMDDRGCGFLSTFEVVDFEVDIDTSYRRNPRDDTHHMQRYKDRNTNGSVYVHVDRKYIFQLNRV